MQRNQAWGKFRVISLFRKCCLLLQDDLKKYEPLDTRDFVPFEDDKELNLENIKEACERFYNDPAGSCDLLASDRGPLCSKFEQIKGRKVFFIRFLEPKENADRTFRALEVSFEHLLIPSLRQLHHYR